MQLVVEDFESMAPVILNPSRVPTERINQLKAKMEEYIGNGAELGWLIDSQDRNVWIYRPGRAAECVLNPERGAGEGPVAGFVLELADIWT